MKTNNTYPRKVQTFISIEFDGSRVMCEMRDNSTIVLVPDRGTIKAELWLKINDKKAYTTVNPNNLYRNFINPITSTLEYLAWKEPSYNITYLIDCYVTDALKALCPCVKVTKKELNKICNCFYSYYKIKVDKIKTYEELINLIVSMFKVEGEPTTDQLNILEKEQQKLLNHHQKLVNKETDEMPDEKGTN